MIKKKVVRFAKQYVKVKVEADIKKDKYFIIARLNLAYQKNSEDLIFEDA